MRVMPSVRELLICIVRAAGRGFAINTLLAGVVTLLWFVPSGTMATASSLLARLTGMADRPDLAGHLIWPIGLSLSAVADLVVLYSPIHAASDVFKDTMHVCRVLAAKILSLDTRGADEDKDWAKSMLEKAHVTSLGGRAVQLGVGAPLFLIASVLPWIAAGRYLDAAWTMWVWVILAKTPGMALTWTELWKAAWSIGKQ